jgi:hypothetical protein
VSLSLFLRAPVLRRFPLLGRATATVDVVRHGQENEITQREEIEFVAEA